ncbi:MAG: hypothetical protein ABSA46_10055 [Thermodesulfovibrionales bacterium]|jgi:hypothetical protein
MFQRDFLSGETGFGKKGSPQPNCGIDTGGCHGGIPNIGSTYKGVSMAFNRNVMIVYSNVVMQKSWIRSL